MQSYIDQHIEGGAYRRKFRDSKCTVYSEWSPRYWLNKDGSCEEYKTHINKVKLAAYLKMRENQLANIMTNIGKIKKSSDELIARHPLNPLNHPPIQTVVKAHEIGVEKGNDLGKLEFNVFINRLFAEYSNKIANNFDNSKVDLLAVLNNMRSQINEFFYGSVHPDISDVPGPLIYPEEYIPRN